MGNSSYTTAVILAGGLGTRLRSVVPDRPKVLANILDRPFLTFLLDQLVSANIRNVVLCTGYMSDDVYEEMGNAYKSLTLTYSKENYPVGTGGALRLALPHLNSDPVLIMNGDSFVNIDLTVYLDWFLKKNCQASLLLTKVPETNNYGKVIVAEDDLLLTFEEKGSNSGPGWINAGVYILNKSLIETIPAGTPFSLEREFFPKLEFIDIGTPETFALAEDFFLSI